MSLSSVIHSANVQKVNVFKQILSRFPQESLRFCFAYGSGVFKQVNNYSSKNMIDLIFSVEDAEKWHRLNITMNPNHYSALGLLGSNALAKVQTNIPSKLYFNSMIPIKDLNVVIKYGVITENDLIADLLDWQYLYVAGRLHKPVKIIQPASNIELQSALQLNLQSAAHAALLILPEYFTDIEFYKTVTSFSYNGDFRMTFGEDKNKINNIVSGQADKFHTLYKPILKGMSDYVEFPESNKLEFISNGATCNQDVSPPAKHFHLNNLPRTVQKNLVKYWNKSARTRQDTEDVLRAMAFDRDCGDILNSILSEIVWDSSVKQSCKGILTAGITTSIIYSLKKIKKMIASK